MQAFMTLAGDLFLIACIQSVLEMAVSGKKQAHLQKTIMLGCYLASLVLVLRFMEEYLITVLYSLYRNF